MLQAVGGSEGALLQTLENAIHRNGTIVHDELSSVDDVPSG